MGKHPVAAPELTREGVAVFQGHPPHRGLADVGHHVGAADRVGLDQVGHGRGIGGLRIHEAAHAAPFKKGNAKAVGMLTGTLRKPREAEDDVLGDIAIHAKQLAHEAPGRNRRAARSRPCIIPGLSVSCGVAASENAAKRRLQGSPYPRPWPRSSHAAGRLRARTTGFDGCLSWQLPCVNTPAP